MAKKDFDEYYDKICNDYHEMIEALKDIEDEAMRGLISPDCVDNIKEVIKPLKNNYMTLSWVKYLLDKPVRKEKQFKYENMNKKFKQNIGDSRSPQALFDEDNQIINELKQVKLN